MLVRGLLGFITLWSHLVPSALGQSASSAYTPTFGPCPEGFSLHRTTDSSNQTLSAGEHAYISSRKANILPGSWKSYLYNLQSTNASLPSYVSSILSGANGSNAYPTLGIATSGGGYRAAIFGAGVLNALDGRNSTSSHAGTGGLLQSATYLTGLSGGSWLLVSLVQADFPPFQELVFGPSDNSTSSGFGGWLAQYNLFEPSGDPVKDTLYDAAMVAEVRGKHDAGFPVTIADVWARLLSRHFVNGTNSGNIDDVTQTHGAGITWSQVANTSTFASHNEPFPIVVADSVSNTENRSSIITAEGDVVPLTNPIYEFNVYEMGSYDPTLSTFTPTQYLGTTNTSICITGFDQASFIEATSSELFNEANVTAASLLNSTAGPFFTLLNQSIPQANVELDVSLYPNPFYGVANGTYIDSTQEYLQLVDGGEDGEVIPLQPLLVKARGVDVIIAIDASSDEDNYARGSSLIATQNRTSLFPSAYSFPPVPTSLDEFTRDNLTAHPTFFGCNSSAPTPLLIYIPNGQAPPGEPSLTNTSTLQIQYQPADVQAMLDQSFTIATLKGMDADWPACLACAVVDKARDRVGVQRSGLCGSCFSRYCWGGTNSTTGTGGSSSSAGSRRLSMNSWLLTVTLAISLAWFL